MNTQQTRQAQSTRQTQSTEGRRYKAEYFRNLHRFAVWLARWQEKGKEADEIARQVLEGESLNRARAWKAEK